MMSEYIKHNMLIVCNTTNEKVIGYSAYIKSNHFNNLKNAILSLQNNDTCFKCGNKSTTIIHSHYNTLGCEKGDEIKPVCNSCYENILNEKDIKDYTFPVRKAPGDKKRKPSTPRICQNCRSYTRSVKGYSYYCLFHRRSIKPKTQACNKYVMARRCKSNYGVKIIPSGVIGR